MTAGSKERTLARGPRWPDSSTGLIRRGSPTDAAAIRDFVCRLSSRSQYFRFFASVSPPSTGLLRALCGASGTADILVMTDGNGVLIGHGMAADARTEDGRLEANIGLVIGDEWQERGLGSALLAQLVSRAAGRGVHALVLDVLPENDRMRHIIRRRWPDAAPLRTRDALVFRPLIAPADAGHPMQLPAAVDLRCLDRRAISPAGGNHVSGRTAA